MGALLVRGALGDAQPAGLVHNGSWELSLLVDAPSGGNGGGIRTVCRGVAQAAWRGACVCGAEVNDRALEKSSGEGRGRCGHPQDGIVFLDRRSM